VDTITHATRSGRLLQKARLTTSELETKDLRRLEINWDEVEEAAKDGDG